ncbi:MAG: hypothetical protein IKN15_05825 [Bacteroidaceae bacterium]|nr:hypothetical protein [Bacteroidaceae bacterium]
MATVVLFVIGFAASGEENNSNGESPNKSQQTELTQDSEADEKEVQVPQKSKKEEIRELGYNDGVNFGSSDKGNALRSYIQMGQTLEEGLSHIQHVIAKTAYKEDYGDDISDELLDEYCEQFIEGYKSIVIKK